MLGIFATKKSYKDSGLLKGICDAHSHLLPGVDDGIRTIEESLSALAYMESNGVAEVWFTPHVMEDVPNATAHLKERFAQLQEAYSGKMKLNLAAEYMLDNLFVDRLASRDLLTHGEDCLLVETSTWQPPIDLWAILEDVKSAGYRPIIAHPERYRYMEMPDYERLVGMGCVLQLNLPALIGVYGDDVRKKAEHLLADSKYGMVGFDCHRLRSLESQYASKKLSPAIIEAIRKITCR